MKQMLAGRVRNTDTIKVAEVVFQHVKL